MDRNFHTDDFEALLREKSDEFRMYPSKRIWHSIYNNIHPGRKWPSVAMSITLITAILLMGYFNTNNPNLYAVSGTNLLQQKVFAQTKPSQFVSQTLTEHTINPNEIAGNVINNKTSAASNNRIRKDNKKIGASASTGLLVTINGQQSISQDMDYNIGPTHLNSSVKETIYPFITEIISMPPFRDGQIEISSEDKIASADGQSGNLSAAQKIITNNFIENVPTNFAVQDNNKKITVIIQRGASAIEKNDQALNKKYLISVEEKDWIENYALYNRPASKKWANKLAWQMYATPSVVYRMLYNDLLFSNTLNTSPVVISATNQDVNKVVNQKPSIGFELGTGIQYSIMKGVKLKAGLQLNYTRYNSNAFQNTHPVATKITMYNFETNSSYELSRTTPYSNKSGVEAVKLHNETFQVSLPMGADLKLIGNENLKWSLGVTIQPTYVAGGQSYLISSDRRNYVKEKSMLNRWNLNAGFETFITYKTNGLSWQVGPQFRTQLFSTNSKKFAVEEKLLNFGLKFGVSKTIK